VSGARAECGAYRGATALLLCHALRNREAGFKGENFYLIDSFSGTSASVEQDLIPVRGNDGAIRMEPFFPAGKTDVTPEMVRGHFREFPAVQICAGWIPQVFTSLPELNWCFVHLDLTLYEPTLAALNYFYPRLSRDGAIICDGSIFCPGAEKAESSPGVLFGSRHSVRHTRTPGSGAREVGVHGMYDTARIATHSIPCAERLPHCIIDGTARVPARAGLNTFSPPWLQRAHPDHRVRPATAIC
jgi:hypothetical protein